MLHMKIKNSNDVRDRTQTSILTQLVVHITTELLYE